MKNQDPKLWVIGLIILLSVYLSFLGVVIFFWLASASVSMWTEAIVGSSIALSVFLVFYGAYLTFKKKQRMNLLIGLTVAGVVFVVLGAIVFVPYAVNHTYGTVSSYDRTDWLMDETSTAKNIISPNGTLIAQTLPALGSRTYWYADFLRSNYTVIQIDFSYEGKINFMIMGPYYIHGAIYPENPYGPILNTTYESYSPTMLEWTSLSWTPPWGEASGELSFIFTNLENQSKTFYLKLTMFVREDTISPSVTNYRPIVDSSIAYIGLSMICVAAVISSNYLPTLRTKEENNGFNIKFGDDGSRLGG